MDSALMQLAQLVSWPQLCGGLDQDNGGEVW